jgi:hypothetical protein
VADVSVWWDEPTERPLVTLASTSAAEAHDADGTNDRRTATATAFRLKPEATLPLKKELGLHCCVNVAEAVSHVRVELSNGLFQCSSVSNPKLQIPSSKSQAPRHSQVPMAKRLGKLEVGGWECVGIWNLEVGILTRQQ